MFESGTGVYKQNGFWRLKKPLMDPWAVVKPSFHHRPHHRPAKTRYHFGSHDEPPGKRFCEASDLDLHIPSLAENKSLVTAFRGLKTEMTLMREQMQSIISHRDIPFPSSIAPVFCPSQPLELSYKWDRFCKTEMHTPTPQHDRDRSTFFCNNLLPPLHSRFSNSQGRVLYPLPIVNRSID